MEYRSVLKTKICDLPINDINRLRIALLDLLISISHGLSFFYEAFDFLFNNQRFTVKTLSIA